MLTILGVTFFISRNFPASSLCFAVASTQNPPFTLIFLLVFIFGFLEKKGKIFKEYPLVWIACIPLAILYPAYYFWRHGFLSPLFSLGAAGFSGPLISLKKMACFFIDPDIGLFLNWPISLLILLLFLYLVLKRKVSLSFQTLLFVGLGVILFAWCQSRTSNFNHGGTVHVSRYGLWYLFAFFLFVWQIGIWISTNRRFTQKILLTAGLIMGLFYAQKFWPQRTQTYLQPTWISSFIYKYTPQVYNPIPEIFIERQRHKEEILPASVWAVSNTSGNKIFVLREMMTYDSPQNIPEIQTCLELDQQAVYAEALRRFADQPKRDYIYINGMAKKIFTPLFYH